MCPLTSDDKALMRALRVERRLGALRMVKEFPSRQWKRSTLNDLIKRIDKTGNADRKRVTGRVQSVRTSDWSRCYRSRKRLALVLQPVEDTLSTALTNVLGATCALSYSRVLL